ncbi:hypothetical protein FHT40_001088 [Mycolicibacterium sp. BK556]|uniref:hypothetical protein n=1 Tax=unclassified Mycolicibacterium TaxID=2636767 RepID=UPI001614BEE0|nr:MULTISPECIES: hypothetical protein [unclassified Mycolicibacterium]MBB3601455.1 hypothetical protein [Mycolicibacterium sp. BK556]MBB3631207.1 hypothetical protein [Mycolicibacterium sp. BK607]MBB3749211.1 hypothetical protein [Mycolicibacterium sp. BK634]
MSQGLLIRERARLLVLLYVTGMPLFIFLAWVFSEAFHAGETVRDRVRFPLIVASGLLWPVLLVGVAQIQAVRLRAKLLDHPVTPTV